MKPPAGGAFRAAGGGPSVARLLASRLPMAATDSMRARTGGTASRAACMAACCPGVAALAAPLANGSYPMGPHGHVAVDMDLESMASVAVARDLAFSRQWGRDAGLRARGAATHRDATMTPIDVRRLINTLSTMVRDPLLPCVSALALIPASSPWAAGSRPQARHRLGHRPVYPSRCIQPTFVPVFRQPGHRGEGC